MRYWDGSRWTEAVSSAVPPAGPQNARDDRDTYALAAHLSALLSLFIGLPFVGPLVVYLTKKDDPFVRGHAAEALNFNLSIMLYGVVIAGATLTDVLAVNVVVLMLPVYAVLGVIWVVMVCIAAAKAGQGEQYRYPLTIRFVR